jgi:hypothetical protein
MEYEPNPKHKPAAPGRRGTRCPTGVDAGRLLKGSVLKGSKRYATNGQAAFCAQCHDAQRDLWHGYPINWYEVPPSILHEWINEGTVDRRTVRRG